MGAAMLDLELSSLNILHNKIEKMDEDLDEDVIFENSALYKHLQSTGMEGIPVEPLRKMSVTKTKPKPAVKEVDYASLFIDILGKCYQNVVFYLSKTKWGTENLEAWYHMTTLKHVQCSTALEEEDSSFLENYRNCNIREITLTEPSVYDCFKKWNGPINYLSTGFLVYVLIWCTGIFPLNLRPMADFLAMAFGVCMLSTCFDVCFYWWKRRIFMETTASIQKCVDISEKVLSLSRQSLRLVQEKVLVARGFTLVSQRISGMEHTASPNTAKLCSELRKTTFLVARSGMLAFREATLKLLELHPLIPEVDSVSNYLASVPLSDYGPCLHALEQELEDVTHLSRLTDEFSVAALKGMNQLFSLYLSEFIRRLTLCFITDAQLQGSPAPFDKLKILMEELYLKLEKDHLQLKRSYDYHKSSPLNREPSKTKFNQSKCRTGEFYTAVHSLDLHLQAALVRVQELSEKLELELQNKPKSLNSTDQSEDSQEAWLRVMGQVKAELEACKGCWEEGMGRIKKTSNDNQVPKLNNTMTTPTVNKEQEVKVIDVGEYIIEDQVFEGYTDTNTSDDFTWNWEPIISPEDKEKKKKEKEEAKRLLSELRSVISVRAEDRERREKVALEKHKTMTTITENFQIPLAPNSDKDVESKKSQKQPGNFSKNQDENEKRKSVLTDSDILSSTKTDLSPLDHKTSSLYNISPILSDDDSSPMKNGIPNDSSANICCDSNGVRGERIHSDLAKGEITYSDDSLVSVSALEEMEFSKKHKKHMISKPGYLTSNISDSEYSTTSSILGGNCQNSLDIDSSSFKEESKTNPSDSLETSSGFFEQQQKLIPCTTQAAENFGETFPINNSGKETESQLMKPVTTELRRTQERNKENIYPTAGTDSKAEQRTDSTESSSGGIEEVEISGIGVLLDDSSSLSVSDPKNMKVSSDSFYSPVSSFSNDISGVAPLLDSQLPTPIPKPRGGKNHHRPPTENVGSPSDSEPDIFVTDSLMDNSHENSKTSGKEDLLENNKHSNSEISSCTKLTEIQSPPCGQSFSQKLDSLPSSVVPETLSADNTFHSMKSETSECMDSSYLTFSKPQVQADHQKFLEKRALKTPKNISPSVMLSEKPKNEQPPVIDSSSSSFIPAKDPLNSCHGNSKDDGDDFYETRHSKTRKEPKPLTYHNVPKSSETFEHDPENSDLENTDSSDQSFDITSPDTSTSSSGEPGQTDLDIRISRLPGANLAFSANIAAMAAARSLNLNLNIDTFGDSSSEDDGGGEEMCGREYEEEKSDDSIRV